MEKGFALQIKLKNGSTRHLFGNTEFQRDEFTTMANGWRQQPANAYYTIVNPDGAEDQLWVRDIADIEPVNLHG